MSSPKTLRLARCPWCNAHKLTLGTTALTHQVRCLACGAAGPVTCGTLDRAAELWNGEAELNPCSLVEIDRQDGTFSNRSFCKGVEL